MKRVFLGEVLQTIYLDICVYENTEIWVNQTGSEEVQRKTYIAKEHNLEDMFNYLKKRIHPRYTKVIIDSNPDTTKIIVKWIDEKYNNYVRGAKDDFGTIIIEEQMLEMVQVVKYHPKRIDVKEFIANKTVYLMKDIK